MKPSKSIVDYSHITERSIDLWCRTKPMFGQLQWAACWDNKNHDELFVALGVSPSDVEGLETCLVMGDAENRTLWLSGCACGYNGYGPSAAVNILIDADFDGSVRSLIPRFGAIHIVKGETPTTYGPERDNPPIQESRLCDQPTNR